MMKQNHKNNKQFRENNTSHGSDSGNGRKLLVALRPYMFSKQLYVKFNAINKVEKNNIVSAETKEKTKEKVKAKAKANTGFDNTQNKDKKNDISLFWTFYKILQNEHDYDPSKMFQIKQNFCVKLLEELKKNKGVLKDCKVKYSDFEQSILYDNDISVEALKVLAAVFQKKIIFVENIKYYTFFDSSSSSSSFEGDFFLIKKIENFYSCEKYENKEIVAVLEQIKKTHYFVENVRKPINSASYYKLDDIRKIAQQLNLKLEHQNGKQKTKMELYQEINGCLIQN